ncbi:hypothetical protein HGI30_06075 [Paenibacillus albicereus]|uniref:Uncharacterized protein n=1 Tax=Paenibacillus albicereus TaxID=2726185 RepID=A0A6H2GUS4_9BACL|nr:hypothetical protein [Paenibacillus albicereus]QJC51174.1 hypothetical protein HGI30_06075 [Paenibacillus albicereus]
MLDSIAPVYWFYECRKGQIVDLLYEMGLPVELLFGRTYECTSRLEQHMFRDGRSRWSFDGDSLHPEDVAIVGMEQQLHRLDRPDDPDELHDLLERLLADGRRVLIWANNDVLPFKSVGIDYAEPDSTHSLMLHGARRSPDGLHFSYRDNWPACTGELEGGIVHQAVQRAHPDWRMQVVSLVPRPLCPADRLDLLQQSFARFREELAPQPRLYDTMAEWIRLADDADRSRWETLELAACWLAGSRTLFGCFLASVGAPPALTASMQALGEDMFRLRNAFAKSASGGKASKDRMLELNARLRLQDVDAGERLLASPFKPNPPLRVLASLA